MMPKARKTTSRKPSAPPATVVAADRLLGDIRTLIEAAREQMARAVNAGVAGLHWHIGTRIRRDVLQEKRAGYGEEFVQTLVCTIDRGVWARLRPTQSLPDDPVR